MTAAYTSVSPQVGCSVKMWPPQVVHHLRKLSGVLLYMPMFSAPCVICTASGFHNVKALTGAADQVRQDSQWQYPMAVGSPWPWIEPRRKSSCLGKPFRCSWCLSLVVCERLNIFIFWHRDGSSPCPRSRIEIWIPIPSHLGLSDQ